MCICYQLLFIKIKSICHCNVQHSELNLRKKSFKMKINFVYFKHACQKSLKTRQNAIIKLFVLLMKKKGLNLQLIRNLHVRSSYANFFFLFKTFIVLTIVLLFQLNFQSRTLCIVFFLLNLCLDVNLIKSLLNKFLT